ncbi:MAG: hypothetical protein V4724_34700 [Pseudomonadota bacterium]
MPLTICPKCAYQRLPTDRHIHEGVCPACGIAYQKFLDRQRAGVGEAPAPPIAEVDAVPSDHWKSRLLELPARVDDVTFWGRALAWCGCALWGAWFTLHGIDWEIIGGSFLHRVILPFHEFGHVLFMPFGRFMTILGGSLFQVAMPLGLMAAFILKQRDTFGASVMLWWSGQSLVDLSPYISDAVDRNLPLVGGAGEEAHDWGNLLTMMHLLSHTQGLARLCFMLGVLTMLAGLAWGARLLRMQYRQLKSQEI